MSNKKKSGGVAVILMIVVGGALGGIGYFVTIRPELEVKRSFVEGECVILGKEMVETRKKSRKSNKQHGVSSGKLQYRPEFHVRHVVAGAPYEALTYRITKSSSGFKSTYQPVLDRYEIGKTYPCWYDPRNPARVVLEKGINTGAYVITGIGGLVVLIGLIALGWRLIGGSEPDRSGREDAV